MKHKFATLLIIISLSSCTNYVQIFNTTATTSNIELDAKKFPVFENDTLRIIYNFWANKGNMSFVVFNKSSNPIYIDWKKCSFILNGNKNDYYTETIITSSVSVGTSYDDIFWHTSDIIASGSKSVKKERVVFIPPNSGIRVSTYSISNHGYSAPNAKKAKAQIKEADSYNMKLKTGAEITFRNFLTYSTSENFKEEQYIDNGFSVQSINTTTASKFMTQTGKDKKGRQLYNYPFRSPDKYYITNFKKP